jgi:hypothetical protein
LLLAARQVLSDLPGFFTHGDCGLAFHDCNSFLFVKSSLVLSWFDLTIIP